MHTQASKRVALQYTPLYERTAKKDALVIRSDVHQMIGNFSGTLKTNEGEIKIIDEAVGWSEDHHARW